MIHKLILQRYPLPLESVKIGSLIEDPRHPNEDIQNGTTPLDLKLECSISDSGPQMESDSSSSNTSLAARLWNYFSVTFGGSSTSSQKMEVENAYVYELNNPSKRLDDLVGQEVVQKWIQKSVENGIPIYFVTGIQTTLNQRAVQNSTSKLSGSGSLSLDPLGGMAAKTENASDAAPPDTGDSKMGGTASHSQNRNAKLSVSGGEGQRVVAIRVRRVDVSGVEGGQKYDLDRKKNRWVMVGDQRTETVEGELVEAVLADEDDDCGGVMKESRLRDGDNTYVYVDLQDDDE